MSFRNWFTLRWRKLALAIAAACGLSLITASPARAEEIYELEGFQFTKSQKQAFEAGWAQMERGLADLKARRFADAYRNCGAAYGTFIKLRIPELGEGARGYNLARACMGDAQYGLGDTALACSFYKDAGYLELGVRNTSALCQKWDAEVDNHNAYNKVVAGFSDRVAQLQALPEGSSQRTAMAETIAGDCQALKGYIATVPPAIGAMGYCSGIVLFERGNGKSACRNLWMGAKGLNIKMQEKMLDPQRRHGERMREQLESFRPICADMGYRWPDFASDWPY